ncbi:MAG: hypothetical protein DMF84_27965 [Acidobacteria bacterium]|nr:MAG: hypothetical protein DMF84_27965 [Acidobacteriota bacterium]
MQCFERFVYVLVLVLCVSAAATPAYATDYYVSRAGGDANTGTSSASPWQSLARMSSVRLLPGDRVLLRGGDVFTGGLTFDAGDAGTAKAPVTITSYGTGRATIAAGAEAGISVYDTAGYAISNLVLVGAGGDASGIVFYSDLAADAKLSYVRIDSVDVSGFGGDGIEIGAWNHRAGFRDVRITNTSAHGNARTGIFFYAQLPGSHEQVYVGHSRAYDNPGIATAISNMGSGIILSGVNGGTVERSVAHGNGRLCTTVGGPVGIWTFDSNAVVIQHNESYGNHTASSADGGGFDLDQNVSNSVLQYNYSHDNDGAGYLLAHAPLNDTHRGNIVRYNISQNDGRKNSYAAIEVWGRTIDADVYNNTVFVSPPASGTPSAVRVWNAGISDRQVAGLRIRNNILITSGGLSLINVSATQAASTELRFEGNNYYASGSALRLVWGASTYSSVTAWRASGEEIVAGVATGFALNPQLNATGAGVRLDDADRLETVDAYRLRDGSPMIDAGIDLSAPLDISLGTSDFYGARLPNGARYDIGANERTPAGNDEVVLFTADATSIAGAWRRVADTTAARGARLVHPNAGAAKLAAALANPANYFELTFVADAGKAYRLWLRGKAGSNASSNDSVFVQFSDSVDNSGASAWRIGTTSSTTVNLEDCDGCGLSGWGWQDNGWGVDVLGPLVAFSHSGLHTIRVQTREDGVSLDQVVLSARNFLSRAPGSLKNDFTIVTPPAGTATPQEIVVYAADIRSADIHGAWGLVADATAAVGIALANPDRGAAKLLTALASPASFVDVPFNAQAGVPYQVWLRMRADRNATSNDSVYLQFSGAVDASGQPVARIATQTGAAVVLQDSSGRPIGSWGWNDAGWVGLASPFIFSQTGPQTLRIQQREDGIFIDQIVISPARYLTTAPGALTSDTTIVQR